MPKPDVLENRKNKIGLKMRDLRVERGWSQRDLVKKFQLIGFDCEQNFVARTETGKRNVTDSDIWAMSQVFGVSLERLFEDFGPDDVYYRKMRESSK